MSGEEWTNDLETALRRLPVHDVSAESAARTRDRCRRAIASRGLASGAGVRPTWRPRLEPLAWLEPLAVLAAGVVYLSAAIRASMVLLYLPSW